MRERIYDIILSLIIGTIGSLLATYLQNDAIRIIGYLFIVFSVLTILINIYYNYPLIFGIKWRFATTVIVFNEDKDKVLLVWHPFHKVLLPPGHRLGFQEQPHKGALKAVLRETGYIVDFINTIHCQEILIDRDTWQVPQPYFVMREDQGHRGGVRSHYDFYYICQIIGAEEQSKNVLNHKWYSISELGSLFQKEKSTKIFSIL